MKNKIINFFQVLFIIIGVITILEYLFICGLFTGILMMIITFIIGGINIILMIKEKNIYLVLLYLIATFSLCMGYLKLIIF